MRALLGSASTAAMHAGTAIDGLTSSNFTPATFAGLLVSSGLAATASHAAFFKSSAYD